MSETVADNPSVIKITRREKVFVFLILTVITGILYANSLKNGFFFDDYTELIENPLVQHPENILRSLSENPQAYFQEIRHVRPFAFMYRVILYQAFQQKAFYYHLTNIILFLVLCYLVFILAFLLTRDKVVSLFSALLFCVHPQNTTPVNFITGHEYLFYGIFCVLMTNYFIRYLQEKDKQQYYVFSIIFYLLAILSHDMAVSSLAVLFLISLTAYQQNIKNTFKLCLPYLFCALAYYLIRFLFDPRSGAMIKHQIIDSRMDLFWVFFSGLRLIGWYLAELIIPVKFIFMWSLQADPFHLISKGLGALVVIMTGLFLAFKNLNNSAKTISLLWFFVGFLPVPILMFVYYNPMGLVIEPLWFYFSSIGFFLYLGLILGFKDRRYSVNIFKYSVMFFLMVYWASWTIRYNEIWDTGITYAKYWLKIVPENPYALRSLSHDYLIRGDYQEAIGCFNKLLSRGGHYSLYFDMGQTYYKMGKLKEGYDCFIKALSLNPQYGPTEYNIGVYYDGQNNFHDAEKYYMLANAHSPFLAEPLVSLATLYMRNGQFSKAVDCLNRSLRIINNKDKSRAAVIGRLIICYYKEQRLQEFHEDLRIFLSNNPDPMTLFGLTQLALEVKDVNLALDFTQGSIQLFPDYIDNYLYNGELFMNYKRYTQAVKIWEDGLRKFPGNMQLQDLIKKNQALVERHAID